MFIDSSTLMYARRYRGAQMQWIPVKVRRAQFEALSDCLQASFIDDGQGKRLLSGDRYLACDKTNRAYGGCGCTKTGITSVTTGVNQSGVPDRT